MGHIQAKPDKYEDTPALLIDENGDVGRTPITVDKIVPKAEITQFTTLISILAIYSPPII
jgi:hypothetical protein